MCASMGRRSEDIVHDSTGAEIEAEPDQSLAHFSHGVVGSKLARKFELHPLSRREEAMCI
jgi:hypothetical protein